VCAAVVALVLVLASASPALARTAGASAAPARKTATTAPPAPPPPPGAWILVDADTGNIIDASNPHMPMRPASLTKVITALVANALIPPDATVPVSARAASMPAHNLNMKEGQVWKYTDALHALLLSSANDAAVALAERASGSVEAFQQSFSAAASELSMADSPVLQDPAGLDDQESVGGGNLISARDLAIAARALLATPELAEAVGSREYRFDGVDNVKHRLINHNRLLVTYPGAVGMKTGYTKRAGQCLIAAARRDGRTMISVVLHANGTAYDPSTALLDKGFATPVAAESTADQLPAVPADLRRAFAPKAAVGTPVDRLPVTAAPNTADSGVVSTVVNVASTGPALGVESVVGLVALLRVRARRRAKRRRRRRHAARSHGPAHRRGNQPAASGRR
jgi:D-alanyl-D-alanine carboxypeptidase (penicillin-binding protein 5/6)